MKRENQNWPKPRNTQETIDQFTTPTLLGIIDQIRNKLNERPDDVSLMFTLSKIRSVIKERIRQDRERAESFQIQAIRMSMMMDRLGQYDLSDRFEKLADKSWFT